MLSKHLNKKTISKFMTLDKKYFQYLEKKVGIMRSMHP